MPYAWQEKIPTAKPLINLATISCATFCTEAMIAQPMIHMTHPIASESLRPKRSPVRFVAMDPRSEPPAIEAVMPPCRVEPGLWKKVLYCGGVQRHARRWSRTSSLTCLVPIMALMEATSKPCIKPPSVARKLMRYTLLNWNFAMLSRSLMLLSSRAVVWSQ